MSELTVKEALLKAADEIERRGLVKKMYYENTPSARGTDDCPVCMMGALSYVIFGHPDWSRHDYCGNRIAVEAETAVGAVLGWDGHDPMDVFGLVVNFNDAEVTDKAAAAAKFREAARRV